MTSQVVENVDILQDSISFDFFGYDFDFTDYGNEELFPTDQMNVLLEKKLWKNTSGTDIGEVTEKDDELSELIHEL
jgi:hypothetical protein